jgi:hypothetical protein
MAESTTRADSILSYVRTLISLVHSQTDFRTWWWSESKGEAVYLGGFEGVVRGKMNCDQEHSSCIRTIWRAHDGSLPMEHVLCHRSCYNPMKRSEYHKDFAARRHYTWQVHQTHAKQHTVGTRKQKCQSNEGPHEENIAASFTKAHSRTDIRTILP